MGGGRAGKDKSDKKRQKAANGKRRPAGSATLRGEGAVGTMWYAAGEMDEL